MMLRSSLLVKAGCKEWAQRGKSSSPLMRGPWARLGYSSSAASAEPWGSQTCFSQMSSPGFPQGRLCCNRAVFCSSWGVILGPCWSAFSPRTLWLPLSGFPLCYLGPGCCCEGINQGCSPVCISSEHLHCGKDRCFITKCIDRGLSESGPNAVLKWSLPLCVELNSSFSAMRQKGITQGSLRDGRSP